MKKRWMHRGMILAAALVLAAVMLLGCAAQKSAQDSYGGADYYSGGSAPAENAEGAVDMSAESTVQGLSLIHISDHRGICAPGGAAPSHQPLYLRAKDVYPG